MRFNTSKGLRIHAKKCPHQYTTAATLTLKRQADIALYGVQKKAREDENAARLLQAEEVSYISSSAAITEFRIASNRDI